VELIRSGMIGGLSVGFRPIHERDGGGVREVTEAVLLEVRVVDEPAYSGAVIGRCAPVTTSWTSSPALILRSSLVAVPYCSRSASSNSWRTTSE
jgi:phage head maturation protease